MNCSGGDGGVPGPLLIPTLFFFFNLFFFSLFPVAMQYSPGSLSALFFYFSDFRSAGLDKDSTYITNYNYCKRIENEFKSFSLIVWSALRTESSARLFDPADQSWLTRNGPLTSRSLASANSNMRRPLAIPGRSHEVVSSRDIYPNSSPLPFHTFHPFSPPLP